MRNKLLKKALSILITICLLFTLGACDIVIEDVSETTKETTVQTTTTATAEETSAVTEVSEETLDTVIEESEETAIDIDGTYTTMEDVSLYIRTYGTLPHNFITKREARDLGWEGGSLEPYAPGMCIGGDYFGNYEGLLPEARGREYHECDINTLGASSRGAERIIYSNDGLIYYTSDHYESFTLIYGEV